MDLCVPIEKKLHWSQIEGNVLVGYTSVSNGLFSLSDVGFTSNKSNPITQAISGCGVNLKL